MLGEVIKLDRKYPLVRCEDGLELRCEEAATVKKRSSLRCAIGDIVEVSSPSDHEFGIIEKIHPRRTAFERKDPADRTTSQVLAANFGQVVIIEPFDRINLKRIERELVLAHETGAEVAILLSKYDTKTPDERTQIVKEVSDIAGRLVDVHEVSIKEPCSILKLKNDLFAGKTSILLGQSGAGKSSLINMLIGEDVQVTGNVRSSDGKGRHTTVDRSMIDLPMENSETCRIVDMPGIRGLGLWNAQTGIEHAFMEIEDLSQNCKFRDCSHTNEPGCAVKQAVEDGDLSAARLSSYLELKKEIADTLDRRERASWKNK